MCFNSPINFAVLTYLSKYVSGFLLIDIHMQFYVWKICLILVPTNDTLDAFQISLQATIDDCPAKIDRWYNHIAGDRRVDIKVIEHREDNRDQLAEHEIQTIP